MMKNLIGVRLVITALMSIASVAVPNAMANVPSQDTPIQDTPTQDTKDQLETTHSHPDRPKPQDEPAEVYQKLDLSKEAISAPPKPVNLEQDNPRPAQNSGFH